MRRVGTEDRAVLAAQEIHATGLLGGCAGEDVGETVAVPVAGEVEVPSEVLPLDPVLAPDLPAGLRRARDHDAAQRAADASVRRGDDHVGEAVAGEIADRHHPVTEETVGPLAVPFAEQATVGTGPDRRDAVELGALLQLEA